MLAALAVGLLLAAPAQAFDYGDIPADRIPPAGWDDVQWNDPGGWTTVDVSANGLPPNNNTVNARDKILQIIAAHPGQRLILDFPAGTYYFYSDLQINTGNVRLRGAGMDQTTFKISIPSANVGGIGFVGPGFTGSPVAVTNSPWLGTTYVYIADDSSFNPGDFVQLYLENGVKGGVDYFQGQILKISWIDRSANKIVFTQRLGLDFPAIGLPRLRKIQMLENVGISGVRVWRVRDNADYSKNIYLKFVNNGYVTDVDSKFCANEHIVLIYSRNLVVARNKVHESYDYGGGGHGYGIVANYCTTNARITDNKLWTLRHHILLQKGANHCVISYNSLEPVYKNGDCLSLHGHYAHNNLIEGNMFADSYADSAWGASGPRNTWFRNHATGPVGSGNTATNEQNVIGNYLGAVWYSGSDHFLGANKQTNGTVLWGSLSSGSVIPHSLYLTGKPAFLEAKPWPLFGPGVTDWGSGNTLPALDRPK